MTASSDRPAVRELVLFSDGASWDPSVVASTARLLKSTMGAFSFDAIDESRVRLWQIPAPNQVMEAINSTAYLQRVMAMCIARQLGTPETFNHVAMVYAINHMEEILKSQYGFDREDVGECVVYRSASTPNSEFYFAILLDRQVDRPSPFLRDFDYALGRTNREGRKTPEKPTLQQVTRAQSQVGNAMIPAQNEANGNPAPALNKWWQFWK